MGVTRQARFITEVFVRRPNRLHSIAFLRMRMLYHTAYRILFQRNSWQNQGVNRTEHHNAGHTTDYPMPQLFPALLFIKLCCPLEQAVFHSASLLFKYSSTLQSNHAACIHLFKIGRRVEYLYLQSCRRAICFSTLIIQSTLPNSFMGQIRKAIFPTICSPATHPTAEWRLSTEVER